MKSKLTGKEQPVNKQSTCDHEWEVFKQSVAPDNPEYQGGAAYFILRGCPKCTAKIYLDYKVEKN